MTILLLILAAILTLSLVQSVTQRKQGRYYAKHHTAWHKWYRGKSVEFQIGHNYVAATYKKYHICFCLDPFEPRRLNIIKCAMIGWKNSQSRIKSGEIQPWYKTLNNMVPSIFRVQSFATPRNGWSGAWWRVYVGPIDFTKRK